LKFSGLVYNMSFFCNKHHWLLYIFDSVITIFILFFALPFFLFLPILIKIDSYGPVFYTQIRIGKNRRFSGNQKAVLTEKRKVNKRGRPFRVYKFRTMHVNAESRCGPVHAIKNDPRITNVGRSLRKYRIDKIPQLWNVLKGDMSFIGLQAVRPEVYNNINFKIPDYEERFTLRPGLIGLGQLCSMNNENPEYKTNQLEFDRILLSGLTFRTWMMMYYFAFLKVLRGRPVDSRVFSAKLNSGKELHENV